MKKGRLKLYFVFQTALFLAKTKDYLSSLALRSSNQCSK